jgi:hypothetical protein
MFMLITDLVEHLEEAYQEKMELETIFPGLFGITQLSDDLI